MKKSMLLLLAVVAVGVLTGCANVREAYKNNPVTPDGFNYTLARDRKSGELCDYFGVSWSLK